MTGHIKASDLVGKHVPKRRELGIKNSHSHRANMPLTAIIKDLGLIVSTPRIDDHLFPLLTGVLSKQMESIRTVLILVAKEDQLDERLAWKLNGALPGASVFVGLPCTRLIQLLELAEIPDEETPEVEELREGIFFVNRNRFGAICHSHNHMDIQPAIMAAMNQKQKTALAA
jgi:hypothetical protein